MPDDLLVLADQGQGMAAVSAPGLVTAALPLATITMPDGTQVLFPAALAQLVAATAAKASPDDAYFLSLFAGEAVT